MLKGIFRPTLRLVSPQQTEATTSALSLVPRECKQGRLSSLEYLLAPLRTILSTAYPVD